LVLEGAPFEWGEVEELATVEMLEVGEIHWNWPIPRIKFLKVSGHVRV
jgi:hypothetical protein